MVSNIDETRPITGIDQPVQVIRDNFAIAKIEIGELQARKFNIDGTSTLTGPLGLASFTLAGLPPAIGNEGNLVFVTDASPNPSPFFSDGITWSALTGGISGLFNVVEDLNPQLGGALDAQNNKIVNLGAPTASADAATKNYVDTTTATSAQGALADSALQNIVEDLTPQLGGQLDVDGKGLGDGTNLLLDFVEDASAVNHIEIENEATGSGPIIRAVGTDTNVDLLLEPKGIGEVQVGIDTADAVITSADAPVSSGNPGRSLTISSGSGDGAGDGGNILITPGTAPEAGIDGSIILAGLVWPIVDGTSGQALTSDGAGNLSFTTIAGTGLFNVVEDTTPQLGGNLDVDIFALTTSGEVVLDFASGAEFAVNNIEVVNSGTGIGPIIRSVGADTDVDLVFDTKGTGDIDVSTNKIVNVVNPTANQDAATKNYVDTTTATAEQGTTADSALQNVVEDDTPQLGGNLNASIFGIGFGGSQLVLAFASGGEAAVNNVEIVHATTGLGPIIRSVGADTNVDLVLDTKGTGDIDVSTNKIVNVVNPTANQDAATKNYVDTTTATAEQGTTADSALQNVVDDTAPRLGGQLDVDGTGLGDGTNLLLDFVEDPSAVNNIQIENEATGSGPIIRAVGADTNIDLNLSSKGTGVIKLNGTKTNAFTDADESKLDGIEANADVTNATNVNAAGAVMETDYTSQTILIAVADNTPLPVTVFASTFVGRKAAGDVGTMTVAEARTLLNVESGAAADQNLWATFNADTGTTTADTTTDTLTVAGGTGISTAVSADTLTVTTSALLNVVDDTAPQLGGQLNVSIFGIGDTNSNLVLDFSTAGELSVNHIQIENSIAGTGPVIRSIGVDTNVDIRFSPKGTGAIDATSSQIINVVNPTDSQDVATKNYVDTTTATSAQGTLADSALQNVVEDTTPKLGGDLDVLARNFTSSTLNQGFTFTPDGIGDTTFTTGDIILSDGVLAINTTGQDGINIVTTFDGSGTAPQIKLIKNSATPANNDALGRIVFQGVNDLAAGVEYGYIRGFIVDVANGSEDARIQFYTTIAGSANIRFYVEDGLVIGSPTGLDKGAGTINATGVYDDGVLLTNYTHPNHTGDVTSTGDGATVIANDAVTYAKMQNVVSDERLLGNVAGAGGIVAELDQSTVITFLGIEAGANNYTHPNHTGDVTSVADGAQTIVASAVTLAKMADMATDSFIGRTTAATGVPEILSKGDALTILNVEDGATADQTAAEILTAIKTVDGASSGLDADLLDGNEATAFATAAQGTTADSALQNIVEDTTPTLGGELVGAGNIVSDVELKDISETVATDATFTGAETLDYTQGAYRKLTLTGNVTSLIIDNWPASDKVGSLTLRIKQDATGGRTITWPAAVDWAGGIAPTLSTAANAVDFVMLWTDDSGITIYGAEVGLDFK